MGSQLVFQWVVGVKLETSMNHEKRLPTSYRSVQNQDRTIDQIRTGPPDWDPSTKFGSILRWITHFLTDRRQYVRLGKTVSDSVSISTGSPLGCVLSPLLFSLYTNCCTSSHQSVKLIKFADDTTLIGLISNGDETAYRREVARQVPWCGHNNLQLNAQKTVEMIVDFRKITAPLPPLALMDSPITIVDSFRFLGTTITRDLNRLRKLKLKLALAPRIIESIGPPHRSCLTSSLTAHDLSPGIQDRTCRSDRLPTLPTLAAEHQVTYHLSTMYSSGVGLGINITLLH
ncbi:hypothetical protein D4764_08G0001650 [Takifugu flavidus]|uniref:Reverse transcriptase domain-containing protein n=1 Tax=Takifugu flavidus TaxID=433684 RepID=A0A5C6MNN3_9TELE|nr:hypothetical protein D4764_08G0001650 [Takifugu flavidus]